MSIFEINPGPDPDVFSLQMESHGTLCMMSVVILGRADLIGLRNAIDDALDGAPPQPERPPVQTEVQLAELLEIQDLRIEHKAGVTKEREGEIVARLAELGTVVYPPGTPEYAAFESELASVLLKFRVGEW